MKFIALLFLPDHPIMVKLLFSVPVGAVSVTPLAVIFWPVRSTCQGVTSSSFLDRSFQSENSIRVETFFFKSGQIVCCIHPSIIHIGRLLWIQRLRTFYQALQAHFLGDGGTTAATLPPSDWPSPFMWGDLFLLSQPSFTSLVIWQLWTKGNEHSAYTPCILRF